MIKVNWIPLLALFGFSPTLARAQTKTLESLEAEANKFRKLYMRPTTPPHPKKNPPSEAKHVLGKTLFFDPRLSASGIMSCATCHNPGISWEDGLPVAKGHNMKALKRRTPTLLNVAWVDPLMWDGRAATLEEQALGPILSPDEMALPSTDELLKILGSIPGYSTLFQGAFPGESQPITVANFQNAVASYQRSIISGQSPFDLWVAGDSRAISPEAKRGFVLFNTKANCGACHSGWRFSDDSFHDIGVKTQDKGRGALKDFQDIETLQFAFKTPTLRNPNRRKPFMHNGSEATLAQVVDLYNVGGRVNRPSLSNEIKPLNLTDVEKEDLIKFLETLNSADVTETIPTLPL